MYRAIAVAMVVLAAACGADRPPAAPVPAAPATADETSPTPFAGFHQALAAEMGNTVGLSYAIVDLDGVIASAGIGYADFEAQVPATADTLFHIGSTHKAMNAALVATLVDDGLLDWDDAVADVVPGYDIDPSMLVRHTLTMTSGISADLEDDLDLTEDSDQVAPVLFRAVGEADLLGSPGEVFSYSNISASLAGYVAAAAADEHGDADLHTAYLDLFTERLLDPLEMDTSTLLVSEARASGDYSLAYEHDGSGPLEVSSIDGDVDALAPSGSLKSTANDMALFLQMLLNDGRLADGTSLISQDSVSIMFEPDLEGYAMGWEAGAGDDGTAYFSHEGSFDGYLSIIVLVPGDVGLVVLTNSEDAASGLIAAAPQLLLDTN